jgi:phosphatidylinositol 4-phosphatase
MIAMAYSGSGAMKSDFTRLNKRTRRGAFEDLYKSILRYIKNNHFDGAKQVRRQPSERDVDY